jgi:hypothetical protein
MSIQIINYFVESLSAAERTALDGRVQIDYSSDSTFHHDKIKVGDRLMVEVMAQITKIFV